MKMMNNNLSNKKSPQMGAFFYALSEQVYAGGTISSTGFDIYILFQPVVVHIAFETAESGTE